MTLPIANQPGDDDGDRPIARAHAAPPSEMPAVPLIERYVRERRDTDRPLVNWALYFFLLSWVTLGIYVIVVFYQRLNRADLFGARRRHYYSAVIDFTTEFSQQTSRLDTTHNDIDDLNAYVKERFETVHSPIKAGPAVVLSVVTLGIYGFVAIYRLMRFWWEIQVTEQDFLEKLSPMWITLGITRYPIVFAPMQVLRRSFGMHLFLTIVTVGIYGIVWSYRLHTDPDRIFPDFHTAEDQVVTAARAAHI